MHILNSGTISFWKIDVGVAIGNESTEIVHHFSKKGWAQLLESEFKVCDFLRHIKTPN